MKARPQRALHVIGFLGVLLLVSETTIGQDAGIPPGAAPKTAIGRMTSGGLWITDRVEELKVGKRGCYVHLDEGRYDEAYAQSVYGQIEELWANFAQGDPTGRGDPTVFVLESSPGVTDMFTGLGIELFTTLMVERPDLLEEWLEASCLAEIRQAAALRHPHYLPIVMTCDDLAHKTGTIFSPEWLREMWVPRLARLVDAWHTCDTLCLFHSDGNLWGLLDDLVGAGIDGLNPLETQAGMTVKAVREKYPRLFIAGGVDVSQLLPMGTPEEVRAVCRQTIEDAGARGLLLGSTTLLHEGVPLANGMAMFETARESDGGTHRRYQEKKMAERLEVYYCADCGSAVAVLRGGEGTLQCCGVPMPLHEAAPQLNVPRKELPLGAPSMEHNLSMPLKTVLHIIQQRMANSTYFGVTTLKNPLDFWVYREIIVEVCPDAIIEVGNAYGGSALAFAHILDHIGNGRLIGLDHQHETVPQHVKEHPRITFIDGDACESFEQVKQLIGPDDRVLVLEDSSHFYENTINVMRLYGPLVTVGSYLIVEDSNCHHGVDLGPSPGPYEAIETFIDENPNFHIDRDRESFMITWNPKGYLKRVK